MKRLLLVDDEALTLRSYRDRLSAHGFQVNTAADGTAAINFLKSARPDLIVLDLMMPNVSGVDVLKFIRSEKRLAATPVVVLTNAYLNELGREAATIGVEAALLKAQCSPAVLMGVIDSLLQGKKAPPEPEESSGPKITANRPAAEPAPRPQPIEVENGPVVEQTPAPTPSPPPSSGQAEAQLGDQLTEWELRARATASLLTHAPTICADLRKFFQAVARAPATEQDRSSPLSDFYRQVHLLTAMAGLTEYGQITQVATVFEALLYVLVEKPERLTPSVLNTLAKLVDCVEVLFQDARESRLGQPVSAEVLVVDDDPLANRLAVSALSNAKLNARGTEDPQVGWQWLQQEKFDLVILDIEMPGLDGFELCKRLRGLPGYAKTPVIYVTMHNDFESRAKSTLSGGDDLIAKPILPMELAAKVVMHLWKRQVAA